MFPPGNTPYAATSRPRYSTAACTPPLPCGMPSALRPISTAPSVPSTMGALQWPMWAMRKPLPLELAQADAEHHAALVAGVVEQRLRVAPLHQDAGDGVGPLGRIGDVEGHNLPLGPPGDCRPRRLGQQRVPTDGVRQTFLLQHVDGFAQAEQQVLGRRAAVFLVVELALAEGPVPVERAQAGRLVHLARLVVGRDEGQPRRRHQAFLRSGHGDVDAPAVHVEGHAAERRHAIHHQQGRMLGRVDGLADGGDVVDHAGGRVDLHDQHAP